MLLFLIAFFAGALTVLAPCILPLLPVVVGGSLADGRFNLKKALTVTLALGGSVILFTLLLKATTIFITIPQSFWVWFSGGIVFLLGVIFVFPQLWEGRALTLLSGKANRVLGQGNMRGDMWGDVVVGMSLGPVFSTCSPTYFFVLATVLPAQPVAGMVYLLAYVAGLSLALFVIAIAGQGLLHKLGTVSDSRGYLKRGLGILFMVVGVAILTGADKQLETYLLDNGFFDITKVEQQLLDTHLNTSSHLDDVQSLLAPELSSIDAYINTNGEPITLEQFRGKNVVLLDIWTYSCINCQRTLPYLNEWYEQYHDQGLEIIGLHTPEFAFEHRVENVQQAVDEFNIKYPVVLDNDFSTWRAYGNRYWPRKYLIDIDGRIVYDHAGEGDYDGTARAIEVALAERNARLGISGTIDASAIGVVPEGVIPAVRNRSPEMYFGTARRARELVFNNEWVFTREHAESMDGASVQVEYAAQRVYMVAGAAEPTQVDVYQDGALIQTITVHEEKLYSIIDGEVYGEHMLELKVRGAGLRAFTFTFG